MPTPILPLTLLDDLGDAVVIVDESDRVRLWSQRVVYMSGYAGEVIAQRGVLEGSVHFLQKPFDAQQLTRALREALEDEASVP